MNEPTGLAESISRLKSIGRNVSPGTSTEVKIPDLDVSLFIAVSNDCRRVEIHSGKQMVRINELITALQCTINLCLSHGVTPEEMIQELTDINRGEPFYCEPFGLCHSIPQVIGFVMMANIPAGANIPEGDNANH